MPLRIPSPSSSENDAPRTVGEGMEKRGTRRNWNEEGMDEDEEDTSSSSTSSSKDKPIIQDADNQEELISKFQELHSKAQDKSS
eukprot:7359200-Karenia_brevis.AAC.1